MSIRVDLNPNVAAYAQNPNSNDTKESKGTARGSVSSRKPSVSDATESKEPFPQQFAKCCPAVMAIALIIINSLATAGILSGFTTAITNMSLLGVGALSRLSLLKGEPNSDKEATARKCAMLELALIVAAGMALNGCALADQIPGTILGEACLTMIGIHFIHYCMNLPKDDKKA